MMLVCGLAVIVAVTEETMFRGYLGRRFRNLTGSMVSAGLISSVIFGLGHGYQGSAGMITVGTMGLGFFVIYAWRKSLVAPITVHFLHDFFAIALLPILAAPK